MEFIVIIPARYASTRLPGKPLRDIAGKAMIQRVWEQAGKSAASRVVIATDEVFLVFPGLRIVEVLIFILLSLARFLPILHVCGNVRGSFRALV